MAIPVLKEDKSSMKFAFDAAYDQIFEFEWDGNQAQKNTLEIWRNDTNGLVYSATQTTMTLKHTVPAGTLENGRYYRAKISVWYYNYENQLVQSERSTDSITFYCFTSPEFGFTNVRENMEVKNANYTMECVYKQIEGEKLDQYQFLVYDETKATVYTSAVKYAAVFADPTDIILDDTVSGLTDNLRYYFRCIGTTQNGMKVDTGYIAVSVNYEASLLNGAVAATNVPDIGAILITSNFQLVWGQHSTGNPTYIERPGLDYDKLSVGNYTTNYEVDLTDPNHYVTFEGSLSMDSDFTIKLLVRNMVVNSPILSWTSDDKTYTATWREGYYNGSETLKHWMELTIEAASGLTWFYMSDVLTLSDDNTSVYIYLSRQNGAYELRIKDMGVTV